ncbi:sn-glycerol-3-phosphate ABC transporter permease UgpE [Tatumella sp. TA1]|uniref:sn-glycerol-3-phosphate ABC transporter permease UgpE n=1 Tax=Rosenbergiella collisarenosi TaxID=1544695 RepID=UPI0008F96586|nr:sn-glycerol-3-phosphate ABC transporter permease UgpE [Rosenbergiella collisarenosi]MBT0722212.1 sn-glycerol-3-phosphate ABC transporter permease UgpE [Rosenbergiella collisarenosi]QGX90180.1 sn-glycerol-3-phosphate ABC transporter permease UgpE [Tatumella sp. TA1]
MIEQHRKLTALSHLILWGAGFIILFPLYIVFVAATLNDQQAAQMPFPLLPSRHFIENIHLLLIHGVGGQNIPLSKLLFNSLLMALGITLGKITISTLSAFALVWFRFPLRNLCFWLIFITLMLPVEVRIFPTVSIVSQLGMDNNFAGLILPMLASATATFLLRQYFMSLPQELMEAARIDGASPWQFFIHIVLPLSKTPLAALFVIIFIFGWNQYLWPLVITSDSHVATAVAAIRGMISSGDGISHWNQVMTAVFLTLLPPLIVVLVMQRAFVQGLIESEK